MKLVQIPTAVVLVLVIAIRITEAGVCDPNPCLRGGTCIEQPKNEGYNWGYECKCTSGYYGAQCQWDNSKECLSNTTTPCENNGICVIRDDGRFCDCPGGNQNSIDYGGHYCDKRNPCSTCQPGTVYCQPAENTPEGRICLDAFYKELNGS